MAYNGEKPITSLAPLTKLQIQSNLNRSSVTSLNNEITGNEQGYINSQRTNNNTLNRTHYSGKRYFNLEYVHNDWSREKKTKFSYQGGENRLMRLKARKTPQTPGNK